MQAYSKCNLSTPNRKALNHRSDSLPYRSVSKPLDINHLQIRWHSSGTGNLACFSDERGRVFILGEIWGVRPKIWELVHRFRLLLLATIAAAGYLIFLSTLRHSSYLADPLLDTFLDMAGSLMAFTFAANAMIRFRGTHDRISLTLALGFVVAGLIEAGTSISFYHGMLVTSTAIHHISLAWLAGRTLLGVLLLAALLVERRIPLARDPGKEIAGAILVVAAVAYLTSVFYFMMPEAPQIHPGSLCSAPLGPSACSHLRGCHHWLWLAAEARESLT